MTSVQEYGAVADGKTDDSDAIQAAANAAVAAGEEELHFGPGQYFLAKRVDMHGLRVAGHTPVTIVQS